MHARHKNAYIERHDERDRVGTYHILLAGLFRHDPLGLDKVQGHQEAAHRLWTPAETTRIRGQSVSRLCLVGLPCRGFPTSSRSVCDATRSWYRYRAALFDALV